ncbi:MAG: hypothetical protein JXR84_11855, partial [Anaerolineae bacterium]|nr:hypothetical protein [Anaerolineae bacterium]
MENPVNNEDSIPLRPIVMHGTWDGQTFFVWGEIAPAPDAAKPRGRRAAVRAHPCAAAPDILRTMLATWVSDAPDTTRALLLPSNADSPLLPPWLLPTTDAEDAPDDGAPNGSNAPNDSVPSLTPWKVPGLALDILDALGVLVALPARDRDRRWGDDLRYWSRVAKLGLEMLARQRYLPGLEENEGRYRAVWLTVLDDPNDRARLKTLAETMPPVCRAVFDPKGTPDPEQARAPHVLLDDFIRTLIDRAAREWGVAHLDKRRKAPEGVAGLWWDALWSADGYILAPVKQRRDLAQLFEAWRSWLGQLQAAGE